VKLSVTGSGSSNYSNAPDGSGTITIQRSSTTITVSCVSGSTQPTEIQVTGYTQDPLYVALGLGNSNSSAAHTGTVSATVEDFGVIGGGGSVKADDFTENKISQVSASGLGFPKVGY